MRYTAETMLVRSKDTGGSGEFARINAAEAGWEHLNMSAMRLNKGETFGQQTGECENAIVILGGVCRISTSDGVFERVGRRPNVFSGMPHALYLSRHKEFAIEALTDGLEFASCWVKSDQDHPTRLVTPEQSAIEIRGGGNATRQINSILPPGFDCHRIVAVEVYTPSGNWSSYPPHKHDVHREDAGGRIIEADLEEIYFYKIDHPNGYAYQRVYTDAGSTNDAPIDGLMLARNHDTVLVPAGYHPVVSAHGYTTYYLNFLAGSAQSLTAVDDPAYAWVKKTWTWQDPRLPLVHHGMEPR
ncbi:MAG: 5-deoxy-glucuronate isomerase [Anaerolineae bacterium]|nr:5-deoxy-glucuronate isomerase [Anaerolineae bacterium]NUQ03701.1 5-deoxy-glucuronate isomerase [Anaerolineae bacterium]